MVENIDEVRTVVHAVSDGELIQQNGAIVEEYKVKRLRVFFSPKPFLVWEMS